MSSAPQVDPRAALSQELSRILRQPPDDVGQVCALGAAAHKLGMAREVSVAFRYSVDILHQFIRARRTEAALAMELEIYRAFVKVRESEAHCEECFSQWRGAMADFGRSFQRPQVGAPARSPRRIAFVFHSGVVLGHTEVLFRLLEFRDREAIQARIYSLQDCASDFGKRAAPLGVPVEVFPETAAGYFARLQWLRERLASNGDTVAIWMSVPVTATFAFAMRMAPVQIFSALRYHPIHIPEIDGYITYGSWAEHERVFHGQRWTVAPVPLALESRPPPPGEVERLRARFPHQVLLGTLAREEKIESKPFLESVAEILRRNPQCGFVWTGRTEHPAIAGLLRERGVGDRCHFVGWVDTQLYAAALDVFLETFPLGCGITGYQAIAAGVPLVSYLDSNTVFGMQYWSEVIAKAGAIGKVSRTQLDQYPVLCARDPAEYVEIVSRLVSDSDYRGEWRAREARFYDDEIRGIARYSKRYFDTVNAIADQVLSP